MSSSNTTRLQPVVFQFLSYKQLPDPLRHHQAAGGVAEALGAVVGSEEIEEPPAKAWWCLRYASCPMIWLIAFDVAERSSDGRVALLAMPCSADTICISLLDASNLMTASRSSMLG